MKLSFPLFIRHLYGGQVLVQVVPAPDLLVFAHSLPEALDDLELLLTDRLERTHPARLHRFASADNVRLERWRALGALGRLGEEEPAPPSALRFAALVSRHKGYERVWLPSWSLRQWVPVGQPLQRETVRLLERHCLGLPPSQILRCREQDRDEIRMIELEISPTPLAAFTGKYLGQDVLPRRVPPEEAREQARRARTPMLESLGVDLVERAKERKLGRAVALDAVSEALEAALTAKDAAAVVIVGPTGTGKTSLVHELAHRLWRRSPQAPRGLWAVDANRFIATPSFFGDWRSQTHVLLGECTDTEGILYVGSLLALIDAGKSAHSDENVAELMRVPIGRKALRVVGEATPDEWARVSLRAPSFARLFTPIRLEEPDRARSSEIMRGVVTAKITGTARSVDPGAVEAARELGERFGDAASVHASSIGLLLRALDEPARVHLDRAGVVETFSRESGMPLPLVQDTTPLERASVIRALEARIVGQPIAVSHVADLVMMVKAGLADPGRPLGSYLFVGPTGVGKTETAKALAAYLFGDDDRLVRFDMSEFVTADAVRRFVGLGGPGRLVSEARRVPFGVLLLDEIEKAHPVAFDALLQVLGEARLSDEAGRTASFRNMVVLMTSNLGAETLRPKVGFGGGGTEGWASHYRREAQRFFRPELFNRIDHIVPFEPLAASTIRGIADRELVRVERREGFRQRFLRLDVSPAARDWLARRGTDPRYGARPLKRTLESEIAGPLARRLSARSGESQARPGTFSVDVEDDRLSFRFVPTERGPDAGEHALRDELERLADLRFAVTRCRHAPAVRTLRHEVRRQERLLANPRYLQGHAELAKRLRGMGDDLQLLEDFDALTAQVESLEELAYEAWHARDPAPLATLRGERDEVFRGLREIGFRLARRRHETPDRAVVLMRPTPASASIWRALFECYAALATRFSWGIEAHTLEEREEKRDDGTVERVRRFRPIADAFEAGHERRFVTMLVRLFFQEPRVFALVFEGPHAAALLSEEGGAHVRHERGETARGTLFVPSAPDLLTRDFSEKDWTQLLRAWPDRLTRVIHHDRGVVEDRRLDRRFALEPRRERSYERIMVAQLFDQVFFEGAHHQLALEAPT